jgi:hypothetical protein
MERKGRIEDLDRSFDIEFWQRQGSAAIFAAAWELVKLYHSDRGCDVDDLQFQRRSSPLADYHMTTLVSLEGR